MMNEIAPPPGVSQGGGFGAALAAERERQQLTLGDIAGRLRLQVRQVEALEKEDLAALPADPYVRGHLRNYARELRLDPQPLLAAFEARRAAQQPPTAELPAIPVLERAVDPDTKRWIPVVIGAVLLALLGLGIVAEHRLEKPSGGEAAMATSSPESVVAGAGAAAGQPGAGGADGASMPSDPANSPAAAASAARAAAAAAAAVPAPAQVMASSRSGLPVQGTPTIVTLATGNSTTTSTITSLTSPDGSVQLELVFSGPSWVEVRQADGKVLLSQNNSAGSAQKVAGTLPLRVTIGNAPAVVLRFRGRPIDLTPYRNGDSVAHLVLS